MKKLFALSSVLALVAGLSGVSIAGIEGSGHDFSAFGFSAGQICLGCHTPHNAQSDAAPLWNHELSTATYVPYSSPSMNATTGQPTGASKLCLSCHDGTVAVNSEGVPGTIFISAFGANKDLGTDLSRNHPISFTYDDALAAADVGLFEPTTKVVTIGSGTFTKTGTISGVMLEGGTELQCQACHSVHNDYVVNDAASAGKYLKISIGDSQLCLACHNK